MKNLLKCIFLFLLVHTGAYAKDILVTTPNGNSHNLKINSDTTVEELQQIVLGLMDQEELALLEQVASEEQGVDSACTAEQIDLHLDFSPFNPQFGQALVAVTRIYENGLAQSEKDDIAFVVNTLANNSWITILKKKSQLDRTKERLIHVHPFRFLECIFSDEVLKVGARNIRKKKGLIWKGFMDGVVEGCSEEAAKGNLRDEYIYDFANNVGIDPAHIWEPIKKQKWYDLVEALIKHIPRKGETDRYDM